MAEVLRQFAEPVLSANRTSYRAQAVGRAMADGMWEAWLEFFPMDGRSPFRSPRETTQSNRAEAVYWATGLSTTYLEGALGRALGQPVVTITPPRAVVDAADSATVSARHRRVDAVLNPFSVYEKGEALLRKELGALAAWHLVNIVVAYRLSDDSEAVLNQLRQGALIDLIVARVRQHTLMR